MNSIVFQEMRETRGLAYSAWASIMPPSYLKYPYVLRTQIATQNDKMIDAVTTFNDIINNMPESEAAFKLAKDGLTTVCAPNVSSKVTLSGVISMHKI